MNDFKINFSANVKDYENRRAHEQVMSMMNRFQNLNVKFYVGKDYIPCAWIESRNVKGFKLQLNSGELNWLMGYLMSGRKDDAEANPDYVERHLVEEEDFQVNIFQQLVEAGKPVRLTPRFMERSGYITGDVQLFKGVVYFVMKETPELIEYLEEKGLI